MHSRDHDSESLMMRKNGPVVVRAVPPTELKSLLPPLASLLKETVNGGVPLGFLPPITREEGWEYWLSIHHELLSGSRILFGAFVDGRLVGTGQLSFSAWPNAHHRVEIQKVFVSPTLRGKGVGKLIMRSLENTARQQGASLILLHTRCDLPAVNFYKELGYAAVGVIPGFSVDRAGNRFDTVIFFRDLST